MVIDSEHVPALLSAVAALILSVFAFYKGRNENSLLRDRLTIEQEQERQKLVAQATLDDVERKKMLIERETRYIARLEERINKQDERLTILEAENQRLRDLLVTEISTRDARIYELEVRVAQLEAENRRLRGDE